LAPIALKTTDGHAVLVALAEEMRRRRIIIPGISVAERMAAEAMHAADKIAVRLICERVPAEARARMDALLTDKMHRQQSELSWLRETDAKISRRGFLEIMDKLDKVRGIGVGGLELPSEIGARVQQMVREGLRFTAQAFQQMGVQPRTAIMTATLRDMEASLIDVAAFVCAHSLNASNRVQPRCCAKAANTPGFRMSNAATLMARAKGSPLPAM
jgi:hypothetical protein